MGTERHTLPTMTSLNSELALANYITMGIEKNRVVIAVADFLNTGVC